MAHSEKSAYYRALKDAGYTFDRHYRDYKTEELAAAWEVHAAEHGLETTISLPEPKDSPPARDDEVAEIKAQLAAVAGTVSKLAEIIVAERQAVPAAAPRPAPQPAQPRGELDPGEHAGVQLNSVAKDQVIEVDRHGNQWFQKEVRKPAFAKPRGRRILRYDDPGVKQQQVKVGEYVETFEVAGDPSTARPSEIKITLPSYQTGIYKPPNMPFKIHVYQGARGFDLFDVQKFYGGADLVPSTIKKTYVSNDLCYDIASTIRTIENEYRERVLQTKRGL